MEPIELIDKCLADPIHAKCKKFLITLEGGSNGNCTQVPKYRDIEEISRLSGHGVSGGVHFRYLSFLRYYDGYDDLLCATRLSGTALSLGSFTWYPYVNFPHLAEYCEKN